MRSVLDADLDDEAAAGGFGCNRCAELEDLRRQRAGSLAPLPHPSSTLVSWEEFSHHVTWREFSNVATDTEVKSYGALVQQSLLGVPRNVTRIERDLLWCLDT
jgi:hypothetical protein